MPSTADLTPYRGRFAPSPTGPLHLGSLYTAVASYLQARAKGGVWLVRMDDLDPFRCRAHYGEQILTTLERFGLYWDESVLYQSQRQTAYQDALNQLCQADRLYACACSRKAIKERLKHDHPERYDSHCLDLNLPFEGHAIRCRVDAQHICCADQVQGNYVQSLSEETGDFIVYRRDQVFAYHLAVVVDDHEQGITEVFRGYDLLDSTPRQIYLQHQLGLPTPAYAHIPVLVDASGHKLSKQTFAEDVAESPPSATLYAILNALQQSPPEELLHLPVEQILAWAVEYWQMDHIPCVTRIATASLKALQ